MSESTTERVVRSICLFETQLTALFAICVFLLVLSVISLVVLDPGTPAYAVSVLNLAGVAVFGSTSGALVLVCKRRE